MIKFIDLSHCDIDTNTTVVVSSGSTIRNKMRDRRSTTQWVSSGSNDLITETIVFDFGEPKPVDYIQLLNFNLKKFTIKYDSAGTPTDFSVPINETVNNSGGSIIFNSFAEVTTQKIYITATETIIANAEKAIGEVIISKVIGTFKGYPDVSIKIDKNKIEKKMLRGKAKIVDRDETISYALSFKAYPENEDMVLVEKLWDRRNPFYILLSGNIESDFRFIRHGWRNQDIRLVCVSKDYDPNYYQNLYFSGVDFTINLIEA